MMPSLDSDGFQVSLALPMNVFCPNKPLLTVVCWVHCITVGKYNEAQMLAFPQRNIELEA